MPTRTSRSRARSPQEDAQGRGQDDRSRTPAGTETAMEDDMFSEASDDILSPTECDASEPASLAKFLSQTLACQGQKTNRKQRTALEKSFANQSRAFDGKLQHHAAENRRFVTEQLKQHEEESKVA